MGQNLLTPDAESLVVLKGRVSTDTVNKNGASHQDIPTAGVGSLAS
jgi:hypothetical protein